MDVVRDNPGESDLAVVVVEPNHARRLSDGLRDGSPGAAACPVGLAAEIGMDRIDIDPVTVVVELKAAG